MLVLSICDFCYIFVQTIGLLSLLCNFTLISLFFACPLKKVKSYKFFFLLTAINDVFISITHGLSLPRVVYMKSYFIIYSTPTLGQPVMVNWIALIMLALSITATVVLLTYSFIYRYLQLCRSDYLEPFLIKKTMMSLALLGVVYPSNVWIFLIVVYSHDSQFVIDTQEVSSIVGVDINNAVIIGFSLKKSLNGTQKAVTIEIYLFTFIMFMISAICALNIASFLKNSTLSKTSLAHYRRMFFLLLVQTACPTLLMFLPLLAATIAIFGGVDTPLFYADCVDMAFSLAALFNPLIIIAFLGEYRNFILHKLGLNKRSLPLQAVNLKVLPLQRHFRTSSTQY